MSLKQKVANFWIDYNNLINRIKSRNLLSLTVRSREGVIFEGEVKAISSKNKIGFFDILPQHANFITLIEENLQVIRSPQKKQNFPVKTGLLKTWENEVSVFLDVSSPVKIQNS